MTFGVTPLLFNVGINEKATVAGRIPGANAPQEKNNIDNFKTLQVTCPSTRPCSIYLRLYLLLGVPQALQAVEPAHQPAGVQQGQT